MRLLVLYRLCHLCVHVGASRGGGLCVGWSTWRWASESPRKFDLVQDSKQTLVTIKVIYPKKTIVLAIFVCVVRGSFVHNGPGKNLGRLRRDSSFILVKKETQQIAGFEVSEVFGKVLGAYRSGTAFRAFWRDQSF